MNIDSITVLVLTYNEAANIRRTLESLTWARRILVIDSFSTDSTLEIARKFPNVNVVPNAFQSFADQCNFGLTKVNTEWVLSLDADYVVSRELYDEIRMLRPSNSVAGFAVPFQYCICGHPLKASLYPPRTVLYRAGQATYRNEGHGHRVVIDGPVGRLHCRISHDDRKSIDRWLIAQVRYARVEAAYLYTTSMNELKPIDRLRRFIVIAPAGVVLYSLFGKGLIFDGWPGLYYVLQRACFEVILSLCLLHLRFRSRHAEREPASNPGN
jgi:glycosyltransferase involved in cell wall biosynthesis